MQSELKPCPFCGGDAECDSRQAFRALSSGRIGNRFAIYCTSCNADMGFCYDDIESCNHEAAEMEIIAVWNTRASDAEIASLTSQLRAAEEREKALREALADIANASNWTLIEKATDHVRQAIRVQARAALKENPHADA